MTSGPATLLRFADREELARSLAESVARALEGVIAARGRAALALSGGETPARFMELLGRHPLAWDRVTVTLVDERFVPPSSARSNQGLVERTLMRGEAGSARFLPLYHPASKVEQAAEQAAARLGGQTFPLDVAVLGMGSDGHTASFFPDAENLPALLDPASRETVLPVHAPSAEEPRLTMTLGRLVEAGLLVLHIEGEDKRSVLDEALRPGSQLPMAAVFAHARRPVPVYWAP